MQTYIRSNNSDIPDKDVVINGELDLSVQSGALVAYEKRDNASPVVRAVFANNTWRYAMHVKDGKDWGDKLNGKKETVEETEDDE